MKNKILSLLVQPVTLIVLLLGLGVAIFYLPDDIWLMGYLQGFFPELLGIVVTVFLVDKIISRQKIRDEREEEIKKIKRLDKILASELETAMRYASFMTQQPQPEDPIDYKVQRDFDFKRLRSFDMRSLSLFDGMQPAHKFLAGTIQNILFILREALINYDFHHFPNLEKLCIEYIDFMSPGTPFTMLNDLEHDKATRQQLLNMIEKIPSGEVPTYEQHPHNMMQAFIRLYHIINFHVEFSERYSEEIFCIFDRPTILPPVLPGHAVPFAFAFRDTNSQSATPDTPGTAE